MSMASMRRYSAYGQATRGMVLALLVINSTAYAQEGADAPSPLWSNAGRHIQLTGKVLCTGCTLEDARKAHPHIPASRVYMVKTKQGQIVTELHWISNPHWGEKLVTPHVVQLRADHRLVENLLATATHAQELQVTGLLSHLGTLYVHDVQLTTCPTEARLDFASSARVSTCSADSPPER